MDLDLKYRPEDFDDVLGNEVEIKTFKSILDKENGSHCFAIIGPAGCGKTTLARIAASHLGGDDLSITELNSGTNRGIDTSRQIIEQMQYSMGSVKVFIMDECHKMTPDGKAALLKPTEEPPEHVYFFFLTTDPTKFFKGDEGKALKTRLTQIKVQKIKPQLIYKHIRRISKKEKFDISTDVLQYISTKCEGAPRTAIKWVGDISEIEGEDEQMERLENITIADDKEVFEFCRILFGKTPSWPTLSQYLLQFKEKQDPEGIRRMIMGYAQSVLLKMKPVKGSMPPKAYFVANVLEYFCDCEYSSGMPGITLATYRALCGSPDDIPF